VATQAQAQVHTFIFTDLVGFTALADERGDDHAADVALAFYRYVRELLADHRAEELKTLGDGVMLRCDDPALAIGLGLDIVDTLADVDGFPPVRVGIHSGPAVLRGGDWYGTTVNVAARLCGAAGGGEVLVSEATHAAAERAHVKVSERRLHWLKNVREPVAARLALERAESCRWHGRFRLGSLHELKRTLRTRPEGAAP
jgi:class 3 adenylate cyclase